MTAEDMLPVLRVAVVFKLIIVCQYYSNYYYSCTAKVKILMSDINFKYCYSIVIKVFIINQHLFSHKKTINIKYVNLKAECNERRYHL